MAVNINNMTFLNMPVYPFIDKVPTVSRNMMIPSYYDDWSSSFLRNVGTYLSDYPASYSKTTTILSSKTYDQLTNCLLGQLYIYPLRSCYPPINGNADI
jgi:hypothetical protein